MQIFCEIQIINGSETGIFQPIESSLIHQYMQLVLEAKNLEMQEHCLIYEQITCNVNNRRQPVADAENLSHFR